MSASAKRRARRARARRVDAQPSPLVEAYQRATRLKVELDAVPTWRPLRRRRLDAELERACAEADRIRDALAKPGANRQRGGRLRDLLDQVGSDGVQLTGGGNLRVDGGTH